jgi:Na+/proline symporter
MAARDERHAVRGQIANGILALVVRLIPFILCAIAAASLYPISHVPVPAALWGDLVKRFAPAGLFGLLLVSSLAGYMAAISSIGNWAASYIVNDLYRTNIRRPAGEKEAVRVSRLVSGLLLAAAFLLGGLIRPQDLDKWVLFINSSLIVFSLPLAWLKWFWWRTNAVGDMVGILGGFPAGYFIWFGSDAILPLSLRARLGHLTGLNWNGIVPAFSDLNRFPFWMGFAVLFLGGAICILLATLLTRPEPMETLEDFYKCVRPAGLWGPVRRSLAAKGDEPAATRLSSSLVVSAFGMLFYFFLCIALFAFCGDRLILGSCTAAVAVALGVLFARRAENELAADKFTTLASAVGEVDR